jgi:hypothetical protein
MAASHALPGFLRVVASDYRFDENCKPVGKKKTAAVAPER